MEEKKRVLPASSPWKHFKFTLVLLAAIFGGFSGIHQIPEQVMYLCKFSVWLLTTGLILFDLIFLAAKKTQLDNPSNMLFMSNTMAAWIKGKHASKFVDHITYAAIIAAFAGSGQWVLGGLWLWAWRQDFTHRAYAQKFLDGLDYKSYVEVLNGVGFDENGKKLKEES